MSGEPAAFSVLISALGGEGGGVLAQWIVHAAEAEDLPVSATSVPGVAQRTGATTYYIEIVTERHPPGGADPILALAPTPGLVDVVLATELAEAGRSAERGFISRDRTTVIAATHRVYAIAEKAHGGDGRAETGRIRQAVTRLARRAVLLDARAIAEGARAPLNAVLLGALAGSGAVPISAPALRAGIRRHGIKVDANLRGFDAGLAGEAEPGEAVAAGTIGPALPHALDRRTAAMEPEALRDVARHGAARINDHQDEREAHLYLDRVAAVRAAESGAPERPATTETARQLALATAYEDVVRVAQLKVRRSRFERIRREVGAGPDDLLDLVEFLDPGIDEVASLLPPALGRRLEAWADRGGRRERLRFPMKVKTTSVTGFLQLWFLARLRPLRRFGHRYRQQRTWIEAWLETVRAAAHLDSELATEVASCAELIKGYAETRRRGHAQFERIMNECLKPAFEGSQPVPLTIGKIRSARMAAAATPEQPRPAATAESAGHDHRVGA